jgi:hypothetical protein
MGLEDPIRLFGKSKLIAADSAVNEMANRRNHIPPLAAGSLSSFCLRTSIKAGTL